MEWLLTISRRSVHPTCPCCREEASMPPVRVIAPEDTSKNESAGIVENSTIDENQNFELRINDIHEDASLVLTPTASSPPIDPDSLSLTVVEEDVKNNETT